MKSLVCVLALSWLMLVTMTDDAFAYVRTATRTDVPLAWDSPCVTMELQMTSRPTDVSASLFETAARAAAAAWSQTSASCSAFAFAVETSADKVASVESDGRNTVQFRVDFWGRNTRRPSDSVPYSPRALAVTSVWASASTGKIKDTEVEINAVGRAWDDLVLHPQPGNMNVADLQNTLTHEFGHVLGLDHTCDAGGQAGHLDHRGQPVPPCPGNAEMQEATMSPVDIAGETQRRTLSPDDERALCEIYPRAAYATCFLPAAGGDAGEMTDAGGMRDGGSTTNAGGMSGSTGGAAGGAAEPREPVRRSNGGCAFAISDKAGSPGALVLVASLAVAMVVRRRRCRLPTRPPGEGIFPPADAYRRWPRTLRGRSAGSARASGCSRAGLRCDGGGGARQPPGAPARALMACMKNRSIGS